MNEWKPKRARYEFPCIHWWRLNCSCFSETARFELNLILNRLKDVDKSEPRERVYKVDFTPDRVANWYLLATDSNGKHTHTHASRARSLYTIETFAATLIVYSLCSKETIALLAEKRIYLPVNGFDLPAFDFQMYFDKVERFSYWNAQCYDVEFDFEQFKFNIFNIQVIVDDSSQSDFIYVELCSGLVSRRRVDIIVKIYRVLHTLYIILKYKVLHTLYTLLFPRGFKL